MAWYKFHKDHGVVDETGRQILQIMAVGCSKKFRDMACKELVNKLNSIEQGKSK